MATNEEGTPKAAKVRPKLTYREVVELAESYARAMADALPDKYHDGALVIALDAIRCAHWRTRGEEADE